jgi:hypothetical protein
MAASGRDSSGAGVGRVRDNQPGGETRTCFHGPECHGSGPDCYPDVPTTFTDPARLGATFGPGSATAICETCGAVVADGWQARHAASLHGDGLSARIEALADWLDSERDSIREAYRQHNAGRKEGRPVRRPDLSTWGNAYEVAGRKVREALNGEHT